MDGSPTASLTASAGWRVLRGWLELQNAGRSVRLRVNVRGRYAVPGATALVAVALSVVQSHNDRSVFAR